MNYMKTTVRPMRACIVMPVKLYSDLNDYLEVEYVRGIGSVKS